MDNTAELSPKPRQSLLAPHLSNRCSICLALQFLPALLENLRSSPSRILVRHLPEKLRRTQNAAINLSARARLRANHLDRPHQSDQLSQDVQVSDMDMANNPYDPHQQNQEAGSSSDEGEVDLCMCMYFQLTHWLSKKFKMATRRHRETRAQLDFLLSKQNPFKPPGRNYQVSYFEKKWNHQRTFRADHTDEEQERRNKLIKIYEHQATIDKLRSRQLQKDAEGISDLPPDEENQIVHTSGASHSRTLDANKTGPRVGTDRKEEISEAMWKRKLAFKKLLNKYNKLYSEFSKTFPTHPAANSPLHPVDYDDFLKWPLDHESWNDGLYFQTTAPWSVEPDVCSGISCVLMLSRIQEEFQVIAQELARY
ncbi:hypothetical protein MJO28_010382 [Puccinia striiformis f. sp. tritici]|uniref:Uncharacterized protein n=1 Tax=Puccinia striiformis f. sp. tritici TaxID=168172 RepID=A0ACC0E4W0_9BASI|nr:hypothetical protein MJO28_010382 [Puccinia striiformis f. sp. tritici]